MESTQKSRAFLIVFLIAAVAGLTALDMYQDRVIEKQKYELRWLMTHAVIKTELPVPANDAPAKTAPAAPNSQPKPAAAAGMPGPQAAAAVAPGAPAAKP